MKNTACRDALSGLHVPRPRAPCWPLLLPLHQATTRCGTVGLPVHLPDSARVTGNRKLGFVGKRLNFRVADDTPKTFLDFQQLVCGPRGVAPREALLSSQLPQVSRLNSFLPLRLHRNICRRANVSLEQSRGGEYACRSVRAHQCSEADTAIQTNPVLGGISARIHWLYRTLDLAAAMQLSGPGAAGLGCRPNHGAAV